MRVMIAGGGVIGLSIAWRVAARGADVTVFDPAPGAGASWVAGGMLAPVAEAYRGEEAITALGLASVQRWPSFVRDLASAAGCDSDDIGYTRRGTLVVARDGDDLAELRDLFEHQQASGLAAEQLTSREARRVEPALASTIRGGVWLPDDHQIDNRQLLQALQQACGRAGVGFVHEHVRSAGPTSIETATGVEVRGDAVVVATGAQSPSIALGPAGTATVPVRPVKGQILRVRATPGAVFPTRTVRGLDVYVIPRAHGEIAIGATSEERGYDVRVTAGAVRELLDDAWELLPALAEAEFIEAIAGLRPGSPDNLPIIGAVRGGPILAMGHYRHGVLLAPITTDAVEAAIFGDDGRIDAPARGALLATRPDRLPELRASMPAEVRS